MASKLEAARLATAEGTAVLVANGAEPRVIDRALAGEDVGTLVAAAASAGPARSATSPCGARQRGALVVNEGALRALAERKASLLPIGVIAVEGDVRQGRRRRDPRRQRAGARARAGQLRRRRLPQAGGPPQRRDRRRPRLARLRRRHHARQPGDGSRLMSDANEIDAQSEMRATAEAAKAAAGKLARARGPTGDAQLLRALAAALRDPGVRAEVCRGQRRRLGARRRPRTSRTPLVKRLGLDAGKLDGVCDGLRAAGGHARSRRARDAAARARRRPGPGARQRAARPARRGVRIAPRRAGADRRAGAGRAATPCCSRAGARRWGPTARWRRSIHRVLEAAGIDPRAAVLLEGREDVAAVLGSARDRRGDRRARLVASSCATSCPRATSR